MPVFLLHVTATEDMGKDFYVCIIIKREIQVDKRPSPFKATRLLKHFTLEQASGWSTASPFTVYVTFHLNPSGQTEALGEFAWLKALNLISVTKALLLIKIFWSILHIRYIFTVPPVQRT